MDTNAMQVKTVITIQGDSETAYIPHFGFVQVEYQPPLPPGKYFIEGEIEGEHVNHPYEGSSVCNIRLYVSKYQVLD